MKNKLNPTKNQKQESFTEEDLEQDQQPQKEDSRWILYAIGAALFFTLCNESISEITAEVGPLCIFYFAPGTILTSLIYFTAKGV